MKKVNIGLIGLGGMGKTHFYNSMHLKNARLVAVADISKKARNFAKARGMKKVYDDYDRLLDNPAIDCVVIALPNFLHAECAIRAAESKKHVFIEKPLARNVKEGERIVSKARKNGIKTMVGYPMRFSRFAEIRSEINNGHLGEVVTAIGTIVNNGPFTARVVSGSIPLPVPSWWFQPELLGGGALLDLGSHIIDLFLFYFGHDIADVKSMLGHRFNLTSEDHALCFIKFRQGISAIVNVGWYSRQATVKVELYGTAGHVSERVRTPTLLDYARNFLKGRSIEFLSFRKELQHFVDCVELDESPSPSAEEGLQCLKVISAACRHTLKLE